MGRPVATLMALLLLCAACTSSGSDSLDSDSPNSGGSALSVPDRSSEAGGVPTTVLPTASLFDQMADVELEAVFVKKLEQDAVEAAIGYALGVGELVGGQWVLDLEGFGSAGDRAALGFLSVGAPFERTGPDGDTLVGSIDLLRLLALAESGKFDALSVLSAAMEVGGTVEGRLAAPPMPQAISLLKYFASEAGVLVEEPEAHPGELWLLDVAGASIMASQPTLCADDVIGIGGNGCLRPDVEPVSLARLGLASIDWMSATTGALGPNPALEPASVDGGVSWNNNEAQAYRATQVQADEGFVLRATQLGSPNIDLLPFESGMVVSREAYGYGTFGFEVDLPEGEGLWPAIWLLDSEACENPGRCEGYESPSYHEIDVLETRGSSPDEMFSSVHWWDDGIRSDSATTQIPGLSAGAHLIELERRPGLLIWKVDGTEVHRVAGKLDTSQFWEDSLSGLTTIVGDEVPVMDQGPHRLGPMRIVINLAVGGSFAGDRLVGRDGGWWGDAMVPEEFGNLSWTEAELVVSQVTFTPLA